MIRNSVPGVTIQGSFASGNVAMFSATGLQDSGVAASAISVAPSTIAARSVWGNNTNATAAPAANTVLTLGNGAANAPTYSFGPSTGAGMYASGTNIVDFSTGGQRLLELGGSDATNYIQMSCGSTPLIRAQGGANAGLQLASNGTGTIDFQQAGGAGTVYIARFLAAGGSPVNYVTFGNATTGNPPSIATTGDANCDMQFTPNGCGLVRFGNAASFSANSAVATALGSVGPTGSHTTVQTWLTFKDNGGVTRYVPCF